MMIITKRDLKDKERKLAASGLGQYFKQVEVVSEKTPEVYAGLLKKHGVAPERFLMIGNSIRSDILPVLDLGGWAIHVPYPVIWAHEVAEIPTGMQDRFYEIDHLGQLTELVARLENGQME
jgi:putative hydrolase of the HAD superfamily